MSPSTRTLTRELRLLAAADPAEARNRRTRLLAEWRGASAGLLAQVLSAAIELGTAEGRLAALGRESGELRARLRDAGLSLSEAAGAVDGDAPVSAVAEARARIVGVSAEVGRLPVAPPRQEFV
ncbi:hypothetical protein [Herbidospora sp. NBRC 101105]|uniref:hypothetical protein n=1 Tax=Herbidospora sp. NBRC 101105 TaxID=3032195 RepID=UPI0024A54FF0|nr:hypothetical protein [Herbidospora sp. NBRC 101105]GLX92909.1 hypothetical protein Hesp01_08590 [Herbidospora sp. NBRC 101105]